jgi:4-hydroxy-tetrahydrodipicolinate synthase
VIKMKKNFLRGSYPPAVTPFKNGKVDFAKFEEIVDYMIDNGSHGVLVTGTTGEPSTLTSDERKQLYKIAVDVAAKRVPIVAATGSQSEAETMDLSFAAEKAGVDSLLVVTPYYVRPPQRGLVEYYVQIGKKIDLPLMIYHIPGRTAVSVTLDTVEQIMNRTENLVGIKHAVNDLGFVTHALDRFGFDFRVFVGLEDLSFPMLCIGACGLMNAVGNVAPRKVAELYEQTVAGNIDKARKLHYELTELNEAVFYDTNPIAIKYILMKMGVLDKNEHRLPMMPATAEVAARLDGVMKRAGLSNGKKSKKKAA